LANALILLAGIFLLPPLMFAPHDAVRKEIFNLEFRYRHGVDAVAITSDSTRVLSGAGDGSIKIWDIEKGEEIVTLLGHNDQVTGIAIAADGKRTVSASKDATLKVWDPEKRKEIGSLEIDPFGNTGSLQRNFQSLSMTVWQSPIQVGKVR
jgi:WD40 repeat protein